MWLHWECEPSRLLIHCGIFYFFFSRAARLRWSTHQALLFIYQHSLFRLPISISISPFVYQFFFLNFVVHLIILYLISSRVRNLLIIQAFLKQIPKGIVKDSILQGNNLNSKSHVFAPQINHDTGLWDSGCTRYKAIYVLWLWEISKSQWTRLFLDFASGIFSNSLLLNHFSSNTWFVISLSIVRLCIHIGVF